MSVRRTVALSAAALLAAFGAVSVGTAEAAAPSVSKVAPSASERAAMREANRSCHSVEGEVPFEDCVIGNFILTTNHRITSKDYTTNFTRKSSEFVKLNKKITVEIDSDSVFVRNLRESGFKPTNALGKSHGGCSILVGDTSVIVCRDGFVTTS